MFPLTIKNVSLNYPQCPLLSGSLITDVLFSFSDIAFVVMATVLSVVAKLIQISSILVVFTT